MTSRRLGSVWHLPLVCLLVTTAWADKLTDRNATRYGKLFTITPVEVLFAPGCNSSQRVRVPLADLMRVDFDDNCQPSEHNFTSSPITLPCPGEEATLFTINFKEKGTITAQAIETVKDGQVEIAPYKAKTDIVGPLQEVRSILRGSVYLEITPSSWPESFQRTPRKKEGNPEREGVKP